MTSERNAGVRSKSRSIILREQEHQIHEAERIHAEEAAETGQPEPKKRPWWKFWGDS